ncbi:Glyco-hydro-5-C domain-containing protein [Mycena kentingensis (nom. inval.)]|nr:Glyco-hydro-5-C domain-containing protein [Mycena kentingensis (nom. inval.)]
MPPIRTPAPSSLVPIPSVLNKGREDWVALWPSRANRVSRLREQSPRRSIFSRRDSIAGSDDENDPIDIPIAKPRPSYPWDNEETLVASLTDDQDPTMRDTDAKALARIDSLQTQFNRQGAVVVKDMAHTLQPAVQRVQNVHPAGWRADTYDFLTDSARAVRAFCRPWPTKLVGTPHSIDFDISSAHFRLVVRVRPQDRLIPHAIDEDDPATEIFVPLVHYADGRLLRDSSDTRSVVSLEEELPTGKASTNASTVNLVGLHSPQDMTASTSSASTEVASPDLRVTADKGRELVDVDVIVSTGRWAVEGQTLRWWYDGPSAGEPDRQYTIDIQRRGRGNQDGGY